MSQAPSSAQPRTSYEESATWRTSDGATIYGDIRIPASSAPRGVTIINVHGITGNRNEAVHYLAARHFSARGWNHVRFDLYGGEMGARRLDDVSISQHAADLDVVITDARSRFPDSKIVVIGHSLGMPTALLAREPFDALASWDGAHSEGLGVLQGLTFVEAIGRWKWTSHFDHLLSPRMIEELRQLDSDELMLRTGTRPTLIVSTDEEPRRLQNAQRYAHACAIKPTVLTVKDSEHTFTRDGNLEELLEITTTWIEALP
jgi:predicted alpha/beta-fold hydrolase